MLKMHAWLRAPGWLIFLAFSLSIFQNSVAADLLSYDQWRTACAKLPSNRSLRGRLPARNLLPLQTFQEFDLALSAFLSQSITGTLAQATNWIGGSPAPSGFFDPDRAYFVKQTDPSSAALPFQPFALKHTVPAGSEIFFHADLHGDVHSLLADLAWLNEHQYLRGFEIARTNFHMIFLGDYTDRGAYGVEVLYTLFRLKTANPENVFLARGNHEELSLQSRYGFLQEARAKYGAAFDARKLIRAYDFLPVVIYLGSGDDFIQCNHGGMEPGYNPRALLDSDHITAMQLLGPLHQQQFLRKHPDWLASADADSRGLASRALRDFIPEDPISPSTLGFMWNDFTLLQSEPQFSIDPGRAFVYGERATAFILQAASTPRRKLHAVFRGHQQASALNPMMRRLVAGHGLFRHWQAADSPALLTAPVTEIAKHIETTMERPVPTNSVWTFNVSPDSIYGENCSYTFDTFGLLKTAPAFPDWRIRVINVPVQP